MEPHIGIAESNREQIVGIPLKLTEVARPTQGKPGGGGASYQLDADCHAWIQAIEGTVRLNDTFLGDGRRAAIREESSLTI